MSKLKRKLTYLVGYIFKKIFPKLSTRLLRLDALRTQYYLEQRKLTLCSAYKLRVSTSDLMEIKYTYNNLRFFWMDRLE